MILFNLSSIAAFLPAVAAEVTDLGDWLCQLLGICA